jgi:hypothetical protein
MSDAPNIGTRADLRHRLRALLPRPWFADSTPVLDGLLACLAAPWSWLYDLLQKVRAQTRLATATDSQLDGLSQDYLGPALPRRAQEPDGSFRPRLQREMLRERATRPALLAALTDLTGHTPLIFEPSRPADTGAWGGPLGYGLAGGWGSLALPYQCFVTVFRPTGAGIASTGGWSGPAGWGYGQTHQPAGALQYADLTLLTGEITDAEILATIKAVLPTATIAWTRIASS